MILVPLIDNSVTRKDHLTWAHRCRRAGSKKCLACPLPPFLCGMMADFCSCTIWHSVLQDWAGLSGRELAYPVQSPGFHPQHSKILLLISNVGLWLCGKVPTYLYKALYVCHYKIMTRQ